MSSHYVLVLAVKDDVNNVAFEAVYGGENRLRLQSWAHHQQNRVMSNFPGTHVEVTIWDMDSGKVSAS